jgi:hypothetical protein
MMPMAAGGARPVRDLVSASLLTSGERGEVHFMCRDGQRLTLVTDPVTAQQVALSVWGALSRPR